MTDEERLNAFLDDFRDLESTLTKLAGASSGYTSYAKALQTVYKSKKSPVLQAGDNYNFLKSCGELRNLVTHNNDVAYPTQPCYERFHELALRIRFPAKASGIATSGKKLVTAKMDSKVLTIAKLMEEKGLSHVPVLEDGLIIGVFSVTTFFDFYQNHGTLDLNEDTPIEAFKDEIVLTSHTNEDFLFCDENAYVYEFAEKIGKKVKGQKKRIAAVLVTSNGFSTGKLKGIITPTDLLKL